MRKDLALAIILILMVSNLMVVRAYIVDSIIKPSAPQFTVRIVSYPYDVPPKNTTTIDQYTGKETTTTQPGYNVENKSIEIIIENQPFTPFNVTTHKGYNHETGESYTVNRNSTVNLFYNIGVRGHFGNDNDWKSVGENSVSYWEGPQPNAQSDSQYTTISIKAEYPSNAVLDFRAKTLIGYYVPYGRSLVIFGYDFYGQESDWSIQTLYMSEVSPSPSNLPTATPTVSPSNPPTSTPTITSTPTESPTPTLSPSPTIPEYPTWIIPSLLPIITLLVIAIVKKKKHVV